MDFYARRFKEIRKAARVLTHGWESIYYNEDRGFTLQTQALLAALAPDDNSEEIKRKVAIVADFLDIWLARRVWNFRTISYSSVRYTLFTLTKNLRGRDAASLSEFLREQLDKQPESFAGKPWFRLHGQNNRQVRHILARLTHWVDTQCGLPSSFKELSSRGSARPFEIEHIWADHYDRFKDQFAHPNDFETERNKLGGLLLLQRGVNQSIGDATYEAKRDAYLSNSENLLARSLHPLAYPNLPSFRSLIERTGLRFEPYDSFGPEEQAKRQELYIRIAEWVWNPSRLDLDGEKPPSPEPIGETEDNGPEPGNRIDGREARIAFWQALHPHANEVSDLHLRNSTKPRPGDWLGTKRHGHWWSYVVRKGKTYVVLDFIDASKTEKNKALFDALYAEREAIEAEFGDRLTWQRRDDKHDPRVSFTVSGGWGDDTTWPTTIDQAVDAMQRLYNTFAPLVDTGERHQKATGTEREPWNGEFYCSYNRSWEDAVRFGFISGGGGPWYSRTLQLLNPGDRVWVNVPGSGYVGVGQVTGRLQLAKDFRVRTPNGEVPLHEADKKYHSDLNNLEYCEYFVPIKWAQTVELKDAFREVGLFGSQHTVCKPTTPKWRATVERLKTRFPQFDRLAKESV